MTNTLKVLVPVLLVLVFVLLGILVYPFAKDYFKKSPGAASTTTPTSTSTTATTTSPTPIVTPVSDPGVTWLSDPEKLGDLELLKNPDSNKAEPIAEKTYYKVANLVDGGELITVKVQIQAPSGPDLLRFRKLATPDRKSKYDYYYLRQLSSWQDYSTYSLYLTDKSTPVNDSYQSLSAPSYLTINGATLKTSNSIGSKFFADLNNPKEIASSQYGKVYQTFTNTKNAGATNGSTLNLRLPDSSVVIYSLKFDFLTDDGLPLITWQDGTVNSVKYTSEGYVSCGTVVSDHIITDTTNLPSRLVEAGKTNVGDKIYTVAATDAVMKAAYENYKIGRTKDILSIEEFAAKKPIFIWKDGFGDYVVFTGRDFAGLAECGKPVIYLYPEKTSQVSVKVGADITKSEPEYGDGWEAVADPSGRLNVAGKIYDYLFWEGQGQEYPSIDSGFIVAQKDIEATLKDHLAKLGLNQKESADFLDFWLPKMPNNPYVRLTWFGTQEMNKLAPLAVDPVPDTIIRIFLDFEGLNQPINIQPQKLSHPERKGFTLVEWGGLLREEIK